MNKITEKLDLLVFEENAKGLIDSLADDKVVVIHLSFILLIVKNFDKDYI